MARSVVSVSPDYMGKSGVLLSCPVVEVQAGVFLPAGKDSPHPGPLPQGERGANVCTVVEEVGIYHLCECNNVKQSQQDFCPEHY